MSAPVPAALRELVHPSKRERASFSVSGERSIYQVMRHPVSPRSLRRTREEHGFVLIEVMVSALILIIASVAIISALDKSDALAGNQQKRTLAANVAQSELERIRSLPIEDVANLRAATTGKSTVSLNGVNYTVTTGTRWLSDGRDTVDCTANNGGLDYLQATTTVTWPSMGNAKPIKMSSLVSPSTKSTAQGNGSLSIQIVDANGDGIKGINVSLTGGTTSFTDPTDDNGCVAWGDLDASVQWRLQFGIAGYVDQNGNATIDDNIALAGGTTTTRQYQYDKAGYIKANFKTRTTLLGVGGGDVAANSPNILIANSSMTSDKTNDIIPQATSWDSQAKNVPLFPFPSSPYTVFAGTCASNRPPSLSLDVLQAPTFVSVSSGIVQNASVWMPALNILVKSSAGVLQPGAKVTVTDPCGTVYTPVGASSGGLTQAAAQGNAGGFDKVDWGYPYFSTAGTICASYNGRFVKVSSTNSDFSQASTKTLTLPAVGGVGTC